MSCFDTSVLYVIDNAGLKQLNDQFALFNIGIAESVGNVPAWVCVCVCSQPYNITTHINLPL